MTTQVLIRSSSIMGDNNKPTHLPFDHSPSLGGIVESAIGGGTAFGATTSSSGRDSSILLMKHAADLSAEAVKENGASSPQEVGNTNAVAQLLFPGTISPATQNHPAPAGAMVVADGFTSSPKTAPSFAGRETGIVSHLRKSSSSSGSALKDIESALKNMGKTADGPAAVDNTSIASSSLSTISPGGTNGRSLAMVSGNNNIAAAVAAANQYAALILQGQVNRDAAVAIQNGMILPTHPNMLLAAHLGMGSFVNLTGFAGTVGVNPGSPLDGRLIGTTGMLSSSAGSSDVCNSSQKMKRNPITLYMDCDSDSLSEYQCLIRQQIELFEADKSEATTSVQGRNKQIVEGQVGIRCRHCANIPPRQRQKGSMYFPTKLDRIYQAAQNLSSFHLCENCTSVPEGLRKKILMLRERKSPAGGGKRYWGEGVRCLGVVEDHTGLRFR